MRQGAAVVTRHIEQRHRLPELAAERPRGRGALAERVRSGLPVPVDRIADVDEVVPCVPLSCGVSGTSGGCQPSFGIPERLLVVAAEPGNQAAALGQGGGIAAGLRWPEFRELGLNE